MPDEILHPSDQELLLCADGELSRGRAKTVRDHLAGCWNCRARMAEIERTIGDFVRIHHRKLDSRLPPIDGSRALLKMRLAAAAQQPARIPWWNLNFLLHPTGLAAICVLVLVLALGARILYLHKSEATRTADLKLNADLLPNRTLTPGATRVAGIGEICATEHDEVVRPVSGMVQQEVFQEYGLRNTAADNYEVDYLISPGLGGTDDIRNLWPEPRYHTTWNSFVKDQLEDYLHRSVCTGKVDLATAQRDVSTDWISAYKKYFRTNEPVRLTSFNSLPTILASRKHL
jgi:hypothetical protein